MKLITAFICFSIFSIFFSGQVLAAAVCGAPNGQTLVSAPASVSCISGSPSAVTDTANCQALMKFVVDTTAIGIQDQYKDLNGIVTFGVKLVISLVGVGFMIMLLYGAFRYVTSQGDKAAVQAAQGTLTSAIIGVSLTAALFAIMTLLQNVLGISLLNITL